jgi:hypothetical protein
VTTASISQASNTRLARLLKSIALARSAGSTALSRIIRGGVDIYHATQLVGDPHVVGVVTCAFDRSQACVPRFVVAVMSLTASLRLFYSA